MPSNNQFVEDPHGFAHRAIEAARRGLYHGHLLLSGHPGTQKTTTAVEAAGPSAEVVTLSDEDTSDKLLGSWMPGREPGTVEWQDGPAIRAWRAGEILVVNEIDHAGIDVRQAMHAVFDDRSVARLTLPNGETVTPAPGFVAVATMNGSLSDLHPALADRFTVRVPVNVPSAKALASLGELGPVVERVYRDATTAEDLLLSFREARAYRVLQEAGFDEEEAALAVWNGRADVVLDHIRMANSD